MNIIQKAQEYLQSRRQWAEEIARAKAKIAQQEQTCNILTGTVEDQRRMFAARFQEMAIYVTAIVLQCGGGLIVDSEVFEAAKAGDFSVDFNRRPDGAVVVSLRRGNVQPPNACPHDHEEDEPCE